MKIIICFLTFRPNNLFCNFCKQLNNKTYDTYICVDDSNYQVDFDKIIKLDKGLCERAGFKNTTWIKPTKKYWNRALARDKALYYFCKNDIEFDYIWFIEEDVFIPTIETIKNIDEKYIEGDLLTSSNKIINKREDDDWIHWDKIIEESGLNFPFSKSMVCAIRCSKPLLKLIDDYAIKNGKLFMDEALFNTLALQNNLDILVIDELSTIVFRNEWKLEDIKKDKLYHPIKNIEEHYQFRSI